jgi:hypothetical protein
MSKYDSQERQFGTFRGDNDTVGTNELIDESLNNLTENPCLQSQAMRRFNNTVNLINDKTSILLEDNNNTNNYKQASRLFSGEHSLGEYNLSFSGNLKESVKEQAADMSNDECIN